MQRVATVARALACFNQTDLDTFVTDYCKAEKLATTTLSKSQIYKLYYHANLIRECEQYYEKKRDSNYYHILYQIENFSKSGDFSNITNPNTLCEIQTYLQKTQCDKRIKGHQPTSLEKYIVIRHIEKLKQLMEYFQLTTINEDYKQLYLGLSNYYDYRGQFNILQRIIDKIQKNSADHPLKQYLQQFTTELAEMKTFNIVPVTAVSSPDSAPNDIDNQDDTMGMKKPYVTELLAKLFNDSDFKAKKDTIQALGADGFTIYNDSDGIVFDYKKSLELIQAIIQSPDLDDIKNTDTFQKIILYTQGMKVPDVNKLLAQLFNEPAFKEQKDKIQALNVGLTREDSQGKLLFDYTKSLELIHAITRSLDFDDIKNTDTFQNIILYTQGMKKPYVEHLLTKLFNDSDFKAKKDTIQALGAGFNIYDSNGIIVFDYTQSLELIQAIIQSSDLDDIKNTAIFQKINVCTQKVDVSPAYDIYVPLGKNNTEIQERAKFISSQDNAFQKAYLLQVRFLHPQPNTDSDNNLIAQLFSKINDPRIVINVINKVHEDNNWAKLRDYAEILAEKFPNESVVPELLKAILSKNHSHIQQIFAIVSNYEWQNNRDPFVQEVYSILSGLATKNAEQDNLDTQSKDKPNAELSLPSHKSDSNVMGRAYINQLIDKLCQQNLEKIKKLDNSFVIAKDNGEIVFDYTKRHQLINKIQESKTFLDIKNTELYNKIIELCNKEASLVNAFNAVSQITNISYTTPVKSVAATIDNLASVEERRAVLLYAKLFWQQNDLSGFDGHLFSSIADRETVIDVIQEVYPNDKLAQIKEYLDILANATDDPEEQTVYEDINAKLSEYESSLSQDNPSGVNFQSLQDVLPLLQQLKIAPDNISPDDNSSCQQELQLIDKKGVFIFVKQIVNNVHFLLSPVDILGRPDDKVAGGDSIDQHKKDLDNFIAQNGSNELLNAWNGLTYDDRNDLFVPFVDNNGKIQAMRSPFGDQLQQSSVLQEFIKANNYMQRSLFHGDSTATNGKHFAAMKLVSTAITQHRALNISKFKKCIADSTFLGGMDKKTKTLLIKHLFEYPKRPSNTTDVSVVAQALACFNQKDLEDFMKSAQQDQSNSSEKQKILKLYYHAQLIIQCKQYLPKFSNDIQQQISQFIETGDLSHLKDPKILQEIKTNAHCNVIQELLKRYLFMRYIDQAQKICIPRKNETDPYDNLYDKLSNNCPTYDMQSDFKIASDLQTICDNPKLDYSVELKQYLQGLLLINNNDFAQQSIHESSTRSTVISKNILGDAEYKSWIELASKSCQDYSENFQASDCWQPLPHGETVTSSLGIKSAKFTLTQGNVTVVQQPILRQSSTQTAKMRVSFSNTLNSKQLTDDDRRAAQAEAAINIVLNFIKVNPQATSLTITASRNIDYGYVHGLMAAAELAGLEVKLKGNKRKQIKKLYPENKDALIEKLQTINQLFDQQGQRKDIIPVNEDNSLKQQQKVVSHILSFISNNKCHGKQSNNEPASSSPAQPTRLRH
jgi:hypothetical protein